MKNGEHIFEWARNSQSEYKRMRTILHFSTISKAQAALAVASQALRDMVRLGEVQHGAYRDVDLLDAAKRICEWDGEE